MWLRTVSLLSVLIMMVLNQTGRETAGRYSAGLVMGGLTSGLDMLGIFGTRLWSSGLFVGVSRR